MNSKNNTRSEPRPAEELKKKLTPVNIAQALEAGEYDQGLLLVVEYDDVYDMSAEIERLRAENSYNFGKLQDAIEALEPFVEVADFYDGTIHKDDYVVDSYSPHGKSPFKIHLGDYRKAREAVRPRKHSENQQLRERVKALEVGLNKARRVTTLKRVREVVKKTLQPAKEGE